MNEIELFIQTIRNSFVGSTAVYTRGSCYQFYLILKQVYPQSTPWYSADHDHVITCINGVLYDITGALIVDDSYDYLRNYDDSIIASMINAKFNGLIDQVQCPHCDHLFKFDGEDIKP